MNTVRKILVGILVATVLIAFAVFIVSRPVSPDAVSGLVGVLIGGALVEISRIWNAQAERRNRLRLAALDERLEAHQEAYALWRKLIANVHRPGNINKVVLECQEWWDTHCLFLSPEAREAFHKACISAHDHRSLLEAKVDTHIIEKNWADITRAGELIVKGAALPSIGDLEGQFVQPPSGKGDAS